ncbi:MAG: polysaccharide biosynthesis/export family protein [Campylobacteraceae bacterium]
MKKILLLIMLTISFVFSNAMLNIGSAMNVDTNLTNKTYITKTEIFGHHLFSGNFANVRQHIYNPNYLLSIGDTVNLKMWGAFEYEAQLVIDSQGNIFIPKVGVVKLLGVKNSDLVSEITKSVKKVFKENVYVYADMNIYQNVSVFVTGNVNNPGLYEGLSSDSLLQYIDKANGINKQYGSFRKISILRENQIYKKVDLYEFLIEGKMEMFPFKSGDVILVDSVGSYVSAIGDVQRPYRFEAKNQSLKLLELAKLSGIKPTTTNAIVRSYSPDNRMSIKSYSLSEFGDIALKDGDEVEFLPDHLADEIRVNIEGEHDGLQTIILKKGATLQDLKDIMIFNNQSNIDAIQIYRKSVAKIQKNLIMSQLKELETIALTTPSVSPEEASMRAQETKSILEFIERAKQVEPKGQITINEKTLASSIILEEGDVVNVPSKTNIVIVQGEVSLPGAFTYLKEQNINDYLNLAGGLSQRANKDRILVIKASGKALTYDASFFSSSKKPTIDAGDSVLVLPKAEGRTLQVTSVLAQIIYHVAVATKVILDI